MEGSPTKKSHSRRSKAETDKVSSSPPVESENSKKKKKKKKEKFDSADVTSEPISVDGDGDWELLSESSCGSSAKKGKKTRSRSSSIEESKGSERDQIAKPVGTRHGPGSGVILPPPSPLRGGAHSSSGAESPSSGGSLMQMLRASRSPSQAGGLVAHSVSSSDDHSSAPPSPDLKGGSFIRRPSRDRDRTLPADVSTGSSTGSLLNALRNSPKPASPSPVGLPIPSGAPISRIRPERGSSGMFLPLQMLSDSSGGSSGASPVGGGSLIVPRHSSQLAVSPGRTQSMGGGSGLDGFSSPSAPSSEHSSFDRMNLMMRSSTTASETAAGGAPRISAMGPGTRMIKAKSTVSDRTVSDFFRNRLQSDSLSSKVMLQMSRPKSDRENDDRLSDASEDSGESIYSSDTDEDDRPHNDDDDDEEGMDRSAGHPFEMEETERSRLLRRGGASAASLATLGGGLVQLKKASHTSVQAKQANREESDEEVNVEHGHVQEEEEEGEEEEEEEEEEEDTEELDTEDELDEANGLEDSRNLPHPEEEEEEEEEGEEPEEMAKKGTDVERRRTHRSKPATPSSHSEEGRVASKKKTKKPSPKLKTPPNASSPSRKPTSEASKVQRKTSAAAAQKKKKKKKKIQEEVERDKDEEEEGEEGEGEGEGEEEEEEEEEDGRRRVHSVRRGPVSKGGPVVAAFSHSESQLVMGGSEERSAPSNTVLQPSKLIRSTTRPIPLEPTALRLRARGPSSGSDRSSGEENNSESTLTSIVVSSLPNGNGNANANGNGGGGSRARVQSLTAAASRLFPRPASRTPLDGSSSGTGFSGESGSESDTTSVVLPPMAPLDNGEEEWADSLFPAHLAPMLPLSVKTSFSVKAFGTYVLPELNLGIGILSPPSSSSSTPSSPSSSSWIQNEEQLIRQLTSGGRVGFGMVDMLFAAERTQREHVARALVHVFEARGEMVGLLQHVLALEVETYLAQDVLDYTTVFRQDSVATAVMSQYAHVTGVETVRSLLAPTVVELFSARRRSHSYEIEPRRLSQQRASGALRANVRRLRQVCGQLLDALLDNVAAYPKQVRFAAWCLAVACERILRHPNVTHSQQNAATSLFHDPVASSIGGFFFLRFVCPLLISAANFGVSPDQLQGQGAQALRGVILAAKIIQMLANGVRFGDDLGVHELNDLLVVYKPRMLTFLHELPVEPTPTNMPVPVSAPQDVMLASVDFLRGIVLKHRELFLPFLDSSSF